MTGPGARAEAIGPPHRRSLGHRAKRLLLGEAIPTDREREQRVSTAVGLAVFCSDPISSTAYATEEILLVLAAAGAVGAVSLGIAAAIVLLLLLLVISYRQVIAAYPSAGGAYVVSRDNFGTPVAAVAGSALLIDYVLTVAVSTSSGVEAMISLAPALASLRVPLCIACIVILACCNLRGLREAGRVFVVPTYAYVALGCAVVALGVARWVSGSLHHVAYVGSEASRLSAPLGVSHAVGLLVVLHAFAAGTTALTGVEAVSNGVSAFEEPRARNARRTLVLMAVAMATLFLGVTLLAHLLDVRPYADGYPTVLAQVGRAVLGDGMIGRATFIAFQSATLFILVLAANTSFNGFPMLASFAAADALLPRQLRARGHRLVHSNGIVVLAVVAVALELAHGGRTHSLVPLYAIGVVLSFTLAQAGMVVRHRRLREPGWRAGILMNGAGLLATAVALVVIIVTKFWDGAWMVCVAVPVITWALLQVQRTYVREDEELRVGLSQSLQHPLPRRQVLVLVEDVDKALMGALQYARDLAPDAARAIHINIDPEQAERVRRLWDLHQIDFPLEVIDAPDRDLLSAVQAAVRRHQRDDTDTTVLVPKRVYRSAWSRLLHDQSAREVFHAIEHLEHVHQAVVPYYLRR